MNRRRYVRPLLVALVVLCWVFLGVWWWAGSPLRSDEQVLLFPSAAHLDEQGQQWVVPVHGWVFEPEDDAIERAALVKLAGKAVAVGDDESARAILHHRLMPFLADNQRNKRLVVRMGDHQLRLDPSDAGGHFYGTLAVPAAEAAELAAQGKLILEVMGTHRAVAPVSLIGARGVSVISDIDDTIKITEVTDKQALVRNTFTRPFVAAPGMAELYRRWAEAGAVFHYVSSSPWQLYGPLWRFMEGSGFPLATLHLKRFRLRDSTILDLLADPRETKPASIEPILRRYPDHQFRLVGDSGERDPEVYGDIARAHRSQIAGIYIRNVTGEPADGERFRTAFADLPDELWQVFTDPAELDAPAPGQGDPELPPRPEHAAPVGSAPIDTAPIDTPPVEATSRPSGGQ